MVVSASEWVDVVVTVVALGTVVAFATVSGGAEAVLLAVWVTVVTFVTVFGTVCLAVSGAVRLCNVLSVVV